MAHELLRDDNGKASIMYVDEVPWHGLGQRHMTPPTAAEAIDAVCLNWQVAKTPLRLVLAVLVFCLPVLSVRAGQWTYNSGSSKLSHDTSGWILAVSRDGTNLTVTGVSQSPSTPSALPLSDPMPGYALVSMGDYAFSSCNLTSITIPSGVTSIGYWTFYGCLSLTNITIPASVTSIGDEAFNSCIRLTNITIPASVTSIGSYAFFDCTSLTAINVDLGNSAYASVDGMLYDKSQTTLIQCPGGKTGGVTIPASVTSIDGFAFIGDAFGGYTDLTEINVEPSNAAYSSTNGILYNKGQTTLVRCPGGKTGVIIIPASVTKIGPYAFYGCTGLTSVTIPNSVTSIGFDAFYRCTSLTSVIIPDNVTTIGEGTFSQCTSLISVTIPEKVTFIGNSAFSQCTSLISVTIPASVTTIGHGAFSGCNDLASVTIPANVTYIGDGAFHGCLGLTAINVDSGNSAYTSIDGILYNKSQTVLIQCPGGKTGGVTISVSVTTIGDNAFSGCTSLTSVTIPDSVTSIGSSMFSGCTSLTSVTIPASVTSIGSYAFNGCTGLTSVTIPASVTNIGNSAFYNCASLTHFTVHPDNLNYASVEGLLFDKDITLLIQCPGGFSGAFAILDGVISIGSYAFRGCSALTSVSIPDSVTSIGREAFAGCTGLIDIEIGNCVTGIDKWAFYGCSGIRNIKLNTDLSSFRASVVFPDSYQSWTNLVIGGSVTTNIGNSAFSGCASLTSVSIPDSVTSIGTYAFSGCTGLTCVEIGGGVISIGSQAFYGCSGIREVFFRANMPSFRASSVFPDSYQSWTNLVIGGTTTNVENSAFYGCTGLTSVKIGSGVTSIGTYAFSYCSGLIDISVSEANTAYQSISGVLFNKGTTLLIQYPRGREGAYSIPDGVTDIGSNAFSDCAGLTSATIPDSVTNISNVAFSGCTNLTGVVIGSGVTSIGHGAFFGCTGLTGVEIGSGVTSIGSQAFYGCSQIKDVIYNANISSFSASDAFYDSYRSWTNLVIGGTVTNIGDWAFYGCIGLTGVEIGNGVTSIGEWAFSGCADLIDILVSETNTAYRSISGVLFNKNATLLIQYPGGREGSYSIPDGVTSIGYGAFSGCTNLTGVTISSSVTNISDGAFSGCTSLADVMIPDSVTWIGDYAFEVCTGLTSVEIGSGVNDIGWGTFGGCTGLTGVEIGSGVERIGDYAFSYCESLASVTIPDSVGSIGEGAFGNCFALTNAVIGDGVTNIGYGAFQYCAGLTSLVIGSGVTGIGDWAFEGCESLTGVTIRCGEDALAYDTFSGCDNIRRLTLDMPEISSQWAWDAYGINRDNVESLVIGNNVTSIYYNAFAGMTGLTSVVIGSGVTDIGDYAFQGCTSLSHVTIRCDGAAFLDEYEHSWTNSYGVTNYFHGYSIKSSVFDGCVSIRELFLDMPTVPQSFGAVFFKQGGYNYETGEFEIPPNDLTVSTNAVTVIFGDTTTTIEDYAFSGCVGPASLVFGSGAVNINAWGFQYCVGLTNIVFGSGTVNSNNGFNDCVNLTNIVFGTGAVNINGGFQNCAGLTNLDFGSGTVNINGGYETFSDCNGLKDIDFGTGTVNINGGGFRNCVGLTNIDFGAGTVNIGAGAFSYCAGLTNIVIGSSVTGIGDWAFEGCESLTSVTIPGSVTSVGEAPFAVCSSLTNISVAAENPVCRDICGVLYSKDASTLLTFPAGRGGEYAVPDGTARLGHDALTGAALTGLWLPASVTNVGENVAWLGWLLFNKAVPVNNSSALFVGFSLTNISVAAENPVYRDIGGVLYSKDGTALLSYPSGRAGGYAVPPGVLRVSAGAFAGRSALTDVTIPGSVTSIESRAFWYCGGLTNIVFGTGAADIGTGAFAYCTGLTSVVIGNAVTSIGDGAFNACTSLTNVVFGAGVTNIGYGAFGECGGLARVTVPGGVTHVGDFAFGRDYMPGSMTNAVMSNVRVMGPNTFSGQPLTEVVFTGLEPPRIVGEFWTQTNGVYSNWVGDAGADWEFPTWQGEGDFTVLVPAAYLNNWVADVADPVWRGRPVRTLESARGISGTFDFAVDDRWGLEWTTAGWFAQSAVRYSGPMALQSGDIGNTQTSTVQTIVKNAGTLTFRYRVSSEEDYDFLNVYLDDVLVLQESGIRAEWMEKRIVVRGIGKHKIRWDYVKDDSYSEGADCAWVDAVVWEPGTASTEVPVPYAWLDGFGLSEGGDYEAVALADTDGDGYPAWAEYVAGTDPTDDASVLRALISVQDGVPSVTWEPDLGSARAYTVEGKASLTGNWQSPANATHRFFRVKVSMGIP